MYSQLPVYDEKGDNVVRWTEATLDEASKTKTPGLIAEEARVTDQSVQRVLLNESNDGRTATPLLSLDKNDFDGANGAKIADRI